MSGKTLVLPEATTTTDEASEEAYPWMVVIYDDDVHSVEEVIFQVQKATGASLEAAFEITMNVHTKGRAICFDGDYEECLKVARILREISLSVEVVAR